MNEPGSAVGIPRLLNNGWFIVNLPICTAVSSDTFRALASLNCPINCDLVSNGFSFAIHLRRPNRTVNLFKTSRVVSESTPEFWELLEGRLITIVHHQPGNLHRHQGSLHQGSWGMICCPACFAWSSASVLLNVFVVVIRRCRFVGVVV